MTTNKNTTFFVVPAPGYYGNSDKVYSAHITLDEALDEVRGHKGFCVRKGGMQPGQRWQSAYEQAYPIASKAHTNKYPTNNFEIAMGEAAQLEKETNQARRYQLIDTIDNLVGRRIDDQAAPSGRRMVWPDPIVDRAGVESRRAVRS